MMSGEGQVNVAQPTLRYVPIGPAPTANRPAARTIGGRLCRSSACMPCQTHILLTLLKRLIDGY